MSWEYCIHSSLELIVTKCICMHEDTRSAIIPKCIIELRLTGKFICTDNHRAEQCLCLFFWGIYGVHIDLILPVICSELDNIILTCYNILDLELIKYSFKSIK